MKRKIKEFIVVEGKHDTQRLQQYFECDTIETHGKSLDPEILERIEAAQKTRGIIVFTDPDSPGEYIRRTIQQRVPQAKHAFIEKEKAKTSKKVGIEHASMSDLWNSLERCVSFTNTDPSLSWEEFIDFGLVGNKEKRNKVCQEVGIGICNAKTCFKRLRAMNIDPAKLAQILKEEQS